jgi:hypothetical protein
MSKTDSSFFQDNPSPYGAFFEFQQDSSPKVIWRSRSVAAAEESELLWFIVSMPQLENSADDTLIPIVYSSTFHSLYYCAFYMAIMDIEARGFSRWLCFVFASESESTVSNAMFLYRSELFRLFIGMMTEAFEIFKSQIPVFLSEIENILSSTNPNDPSYSRLVNRAEKLTEVRDQIGIESTCQTDFGPPTTYSLLSLEHELRKIETLVNMAQALPSIDRIIRDLMYHPLFLLERVMSPQLKFPIPIQSEALKNLRDITLFHCVFSLLSGKTLVIMASANRKAEAISLFNSFCHFLLFRWEDDCLILEESEKPETLVKFALVLVTGPVETGSRLISVLNFDTGQFFGSYCPEDSSVLKLAAGKADVSACVFELKVIDALHQMRDKFVRFSICYLTRLPRLAHELPDIMDLAGLSDADEPIFRFWMAAMANLGKRRPILLDNFVPPRKSGHT